MVPCFFTHMLIDDGLSCSVARCKSCNHVMMEDDVENWVFQQLEDTTHLLHGVVHANGFGHLFRVNGSEGGSPVLSGCKSEVRVINRTHSLHYIFLFLL